MEKWKEELANLVTSVEELRKYISISNDMLESIEIGNSIFPMMITPYYARLLSTLPNNHPLIKCILPTAVERESIENLPNFEKEEEFSHGIKGLRVELSGRATIITTQFCPNHCRYCFRKYYVNIGRATLSISDVDKIVDYIKNDDSITECCLSGGEPLILSDDTLEYLITALSAIPHVKILRIFTRLLGVLPYRFTENLLRILKIFPTLYVIAHLDHADELTEESIRACRLLTDNGIPIFSSTVLLKNVNDSSEMLGDLFQKCLQNKIKPIYLYHCVPAMGVKHFMTEVEVGTRIIEELYSKLSALCIPLYTVPLIGEKALAMPCMKEIYENKI